MTTVDKLVESGKCPCEVCSTQDDEQELLDRQLVKESPLSKQVNKNPTTLVRIDAELHRLLKIKAAAGKTSLKTLIEGCLGELLEVPKRSINETAYS